MAIWLIYLEHLGDILFQNTRIADYSKHSGSVKAFIPGGTLYMVAIQCRTHAVFHVM